MFILTLLEVPPQSPIFFDYTNHPKALSMEVPNVKLRGIFFLEIIRILAAARMTYKCTKLFKIYVYIVILTLTMMKIVV